MNEIKQPQNDSSTMEEVTLVADAHLVQVLGEQLIGSEKVGILELIKNAYDAGASYCQVWIEKVPGLPEAKLSDSQIIQFKGPVITIIDDGSGMDRNTIINGWLRPATRIKTNIKDRLRKEKLEADLRDTRAEYDALVEELKKEHGGRLPLGEKGVGRFATNRLGNYLILQTKTHDMSNELVLEIDWTKFEIEEDAPIDLDEIKLNLISRLPNRDYGPKGSGTQLRIYGGREGYDWSREKMLEIGYAIARLRSPSKYASKQKFTVTFHCPQLADEPFEVLTESVPAPFVCTAIVDKNGIAEVEVIFKPPSSLKKPLPAQTWNETVDLRLFPPADNKDYWLLSNTELRTPKSGPFTVEVKLWIRSNEWVDYADFVEFRNYLDNFGGIGIFRDGLSIIPAQQTSRDDWLKLSNRHIKKGWHISYYQMSGSVDLVQEDTLDLIDRTSREGLIEKQSFDDLSTMTFVIIGVIIERYVRTIRDSYERLKRGERITERVINAQARIAKSVLESVSKKYDFQNDEMKIKDVIGDTEDPQKVLKDLSNTYDLIREQIKELNSQVDALIEAAGYGIAVGVSIHEIEKLTSNIYFGLDRLSKKGSVFDFETQKQIDELSQMTQALLTELKRIAPLRVTRFEPKRKFSLRDSVLVASGAFRTFWNEYNITFIPPVKESDFEVEGSFGACSQVFANLFDNATYWLRVSASEIRRIVVSFDPQIRMAIVADSGPGISEKIRPYLFQPFYSLKNPPSGLGLYISDYYLRQMKGSIRESLDSERLPGFSGAHFTIRFSGEGISQ